MCKRLSAVQAPPTPHDPTTGTWTTTGSLSTARSSHTATLLPSGKVLVAAGQGSTSPLSSAELYDPAAGTWTTTGSVPTARSAHTATLLSSGKVLVAGGVGNSGFLSSAELYDPATGRGRRPVASPAHAQVTLRRFCPQAMCWWWGDIMVVP